MAAFDGWSQTAGFSTFTVTGGVGTVTNLEGWYRVPSAAWDSWDRMQRELREIQEATAEFEKARTKAKWYRAWEPGPRDSAPQRVQMAGMQRPNSRRPHGQGQGCR